MYPKGSTTVLPQVTFRENIYGPNHRFSEDEEKAIVAQSLGCEGREVCDRCSCGKGAFNKCLVNEVHPKNGACLSCTFLGKREQCSLAKKYGRLFYDIQVEGNEIPEKIMYACPDFPAGGKIPKFVTTTIPPDLAGIEMTEEEENAMMVQMYSDDMGEPCQRCAANKGVYETCTTSKVWPPNGACASCAFEGRMGECSLRKTPGDTKKKKKNKKVKRVRKQLEHAKASPASVERPHVSPPPRYSEDDWESQLERTGCPVDRCLQLSERIGKTAEDLSARLHAMRMELDEATA